MKIYYESINKDGEVKIHLIEEEFNPQEIIYMLETLEIYWREYK